MPLGTDDSAPVPTVTSSSQAIAPEAPASKSVVDVTSFKSRVVGAAQGVPTGTFQLVIRTSLPSGDLTLRYNGAYDVTDSATPRCRLDGSQNGQPLTVISVGDKLYTRAGTGKYVVSSVSTSVTRLGLVTVRPDLPTFASLLASSVRGLTDLGPDTVGGLSVERWRTLMDATAFAPSSPGAATVDLWLDSAGLLRQVSYTLSSAGAAPTTTTVTLTYGDFNSPVDITEPAASELR
jgi:hypothetical protein